MWKPPQRIKHQTAPGVWPSADAAHTAKLFSPVNVGRLSLAQRTWIPAMVPWRATEEGFVTQDVLDWYQRFAQGKPGAIVVEATGVRDVASGPLLRIGDDRFVPGLSELAKIVREASDGRTKLFIQLIDFLSIRRRPQKEKFINRFLQITDAHREVLNLPDASQDDIREALMALDGVALEQTLGERDFESMTRGFRERVTDVDEPHIASLPAVLPDIFAKAAARAQEAGFDGIELHCAHAYTLASFLSRRNTREDGYGSTREARLRLPMDVYKSVRGAVSENFIVGCRMLSDECIDGGSDVEDAVYFAKAFAVAGMDFISLSRGGKFEDAAAPKIGEAIYPYTGRSGYECMPQIISDEQGPFGRNVDPAQHIRSSIRNSGYEMPVIVAGGIHGFDQAEQILTLNQADIIGFARQALADPDWFVKVKSGKGEAVNVCKYTNYCEGLDQKHKMVTCQLWDRVDLDDGDISRAPDGKRRTTAPAWRDEVLRDV